MNTDVIYSKFLENIRDIIPDEYCAKQITGVIDRFNQLSSENEKLRKELDTLKKKQPDRIKMWGED